MQIETLRDVLHWTTEFHQHLSQCLSHCTDENASERARMILAYLSDHESELSNVVRRFETSGDERALNTWCYEYVDKHPIVRHVHCEAPFADLDATQIMAVVVDQHQQIIELYRYLASRADIPTAKELMETLKSMEEHEMMRMAQAANRFEDM